MFLKLAKFKAIAALTGIAFLNLLALPSVAQSSPNRSSLTVIQGKITNIDGNTLTVKTPDIKPVCQPNQVCPLFIILGPTFSIDISNATFESSSGSPISETPTVGEAIIAVGKLKPESPPATGTSTPVTENRTIKAKVIEKIDSSLTPQ